MRTRTTRRRVGGLMLLFAATLAGCSHPSTRAGSKAVASTTVPAPTPRAGTTKPGGAVDPNLPEVVAPGDIPDDQVFVPFSPGPGTYTISVPEGWGRTERDGVVVFTDKYNSIAVTQVAAASAPTIESVRTSSLTDVSSDPSYSAGDITSIKTAAGRAIKATYEIASAPNAVTGKKALLAVERYVYFANGVDVVVTLSGAKGSDNVDPWKIVTDSVKVG